MKKVRLFAVAAAMGMFASTVAAAEPVVSTSYTTTWGEVDTIIKVDVGDKVVAPTTTIKVVKETRTTDTEEKPYVDGLGFEDVEDCFTSTGAAKDDNNDDYSDVQIYVNGFEGGYYTSELEAVKDYLYDNKLIVVPGEEELRDDVYYAKYANKTFADYEEAYAWLEEQGLIESVYDEDGDLDKIYVKQTAITDYKGREIGNARYEITVGTGRGADEDAMLAVVEACLNGNVYLDGAKSVALPNYTQAQEKAEDTYKFFYTLNEQPVEIALNSVVIVDEYKGELTIEGVYPSAAAAAAAGWTTGWDNTNTPATAIGPKPTEGKITVYEVSGKKGEVVKKATIAPTKVKAYTPYSHMMWNEETGSFVKTVNDFTNTYWNADGDFSVDGTNAVKGFWYNNEHEADKADAKEFNKTELQIANNHLGLTKISYEKYVDNTTDKWLLNVPYTSLNEKEGKVTLQYNGTKDVVVNAVQLDKYTWMPAFDSEEELVKYASKIDEVAVAGHKFVANSKLDGISDELAEWLAGPQTTGFEAEEETYDAWYLATEALVNNPWSGYTQEGDTPENEMMGVGSEACAYVVASTSEEVEAVVTSDADSVDTSVAGVKTLTLTAKVGEEVVDTKTVSVVVAPKYERTYVNGRVSVLKAFHLNGNLYAEYHYDWTAKTYTATFYAQDGVTVGSTANGTL